MRVCVEVQKMYDFELAWSVAQLVSDSIELEREKKRLYVDVDERGYQSLKHQLYFVASVRHVFPEGSVNRVSG